MSTYKNPWSITTLHEWREDALHILCKLEIGLRSIKSIVERDPHHPDMALLLPLIWGTHSVADRAFERLAELPRVPVDDNGLGQEVPL